VTPSEAREVVRLVNPKIAIPKHFWWEGAVQQYTQGLTRVRMMQSPVLKISKPELPQPVETVVLPWAHR
jgi:L-ascorbate metabolism protein UlaG (beta-lactamase superfamily)